MKKVDLNKTDWFIEKVRKFNLNNQCLELNVPLDISDIFKIGVASFVTHVSTSGSFLIVGIYGTWDSTEYSISWQSSTHPSYKEVINKITNLTIMEVDFAKKVPIRDVIIEQVGFDLNIKEKGIAAYERIKNNKFITIQKQNVQIIIPVAPLLRKYKK